MKYLKVIYTVLVMTLLSSCEQDKKLETRVDQLEADIKDLKNADMQHSLSHAEDIVSDFKISQDKQNMMIKLIAGVKQKERKAILYSDSKGYAVATNLYGSFLASIDRIEPYLDGYKVHFSIANLSPATLKGVTLNLLYGAKDPEIEHDISKLEGMKRIEAQNEYIAKFNKNEKKRKNIKVSCSNLIPSKWTKVTAIIASTSVKDVGYFELTLDATGVILR